MILLKNITLRNFLSIGQVTQAVNFDRKELTLILGENLDLGGDGARNGTGKTTLIQGLCYALFGVPINNIRKDNLVNRTNGKGMLVTLEFNVNGIDYKIERGRKPNILKFYVDDKLQKNQDDAQGENKETQSFIERTINMSSDMFRHIVALNTYSEPFLALKANDQRAIIEQLLGITLLSEKAEVIKDLIRQSKDEIQQEEFRVKAVEEANKRVKEQIESIKRRQKLWQTKHDDDLEKLAIQYTRLSQIDIDKELQAHKDLAVYNQQVQLKLAYDNKVDSLRKDITKESKNYTKLETEVATLKDHKCYACGQEFHDQQHASVLENKYNSMVESKNLLDDYKFQLDELVANPVHVTEQPNTHYATEAEAVKHSSELENLIKTIEEKTIETDPYSEQITDMENKAERAKKQYKKDSFLDVARKFKRKSWKRDSGIEKAVSRLTKEEAEQIDEESLTAGKRLISKHGEGTHTARVYKDTEYNEYQVHHYKDGKHMGEGPVSYHDDKEDAEATAKASLKRRMGMKEETNIVSKYLSYTVEQSNNDEPPFKPSPKKQIALPGKYGASYSTARHLARMGLKAAIKDLKKGPEAGKKQIS